MIACDFFTRNVVDTFQNIKWENLKKEKTSVRIYYLNFYTYLMKGYYDITQCLGLARQNIFDHGAQKHYENIPKVSCPNNDSPNSYLPQIRSSLHCNISLSCCLVHFNTIQEYLKFFPNFPEQQEQTKVVSSQSWQFRNPPVLSCLVSKKGRERRPLAYTLTPT